jgi:hypothetical protein
VRRAGHRRADHGKVAQIAGDDFGALLTQLRRAVIEGVHERANA